MKSIFKITLIVFLCSITSNAFDIGKALTKGAAILEGSKTPQESNTATLSTLSSSEVSKGLKEALSKGIDASIKQLGTTNGFFADQLVKILMPQSMQNAAELVKKAGGEKYVNDFVLSMNRAAEESVAQIAPIFTDTLSNMSLEDAKNILAGGDNAATAYFKNKAGAKIVTTVEPIIQANMEKNSVYRYYNTLKDYYDKIGGSALVGNSSLASLASSLGGATLGNGQLLSKSELDSYISTKTSDGLFAVIGEQEKEIRNSIDARSTPLLKRVFGAL